MLPGAQVRSTCWRDTAGPQRPYQGMVTEILLAGEAEDQLGPGATAFISPPVPPPPINPPLTVEDTDGTNVVSPATLFQVNDRLSGTGIPYLLWTETTPTSGVLSWAGVDIYQDGQGEFGPQPVLEIIDGAGIKTTIGNDTVNGRVWVKIEVKPNGITGFTGSRDRHKYVCDGYYLQAYVQYETFVDGILIDATPWQYVGTNGCCYCSSGTGTGTGTGTSTGTSTGTGACITVCSCAVCPDGPPCAWLLAFPTQWGPPGNPCSQYFQPASGPSLTWTAGCNWSWLLVRRKSLCVVA